MTLIFLDVNVREDFKVLTHSVTEFCTETSTALPLRSHYITETAHIPVSRGSGYQSKASKQPSYYRPAADNLPRLYIQALRLFTIHF